jgi:hypothetical protein
MFPFHTQYNAFADTGAEAGVSNSPTKTKNAILTFWVEGLEV